MATANTFIQRSHTRSVKERNDYHALQHLLMTSGDSDVFVWLAFDYSRATMKREHAAEGQMKSLFVVIYQVLYMRVPVSEIICLIVVQGQDYFQWWKKCSDLLVKSSDK